jgi:site-specific recombinase XerD
MKINVRYKIVKDGFQSVYFDYFLNGKRQYEFLNIHLLPETKENKKINQELRKKVELIKSQRLLDFVNESFNFPSASKQKANFIEFVNNFASTKSKSTNEGYLSLITWLIKFKGENIIFKQVNENFCESFMQFLKDSGLKHNSVRNYMMTLNASLNFAIKKNIININPLAKVDKLKIQNSKIEFLNRNEVKLLLNSKVVIKDIESADGVYKFVDIKNSFILCCLCGLRWSDVRLLKKIHIQDDRLQLKQIKDKSNISNPLYFEAIEFINNLPKSENELLFVLPEKSKFINRIIGNFVKKSGIDKHITFHCSRHSYAFLEIAKGTDIYTLSKRLDHSDVATTQIYAHFYDVIKKREIIHPHLLLED